MVDKPYYITIWTRQIIRISAEENLVFNFSAFWSFSLIRVKGFFCLLVKFITNRVCYILYFCKIFISYLHVFYKLFPISRYFYSDFIFLFKHFILIFNCTKIFVWNLFQVCFFFYCEDLTARNWKILREYLQIKNRMFSIVKNYLCWIICLNYSN